MNLANDISKSELSKLLDIPESLLHEISGKVMKGFEIRIQFCSVLRTNPLTDKNLPNISNTLIYDYQIRFNAANHTAQELRKALKDNCQKIKDYLDETFRPVAHPFDITLVVPRQEVDTNFKFIDLDMFD